MVNPIETEMDEAIENARHRAAEGFEKSEDAHLPDLHVKQKYMGHRNARWDFTMPFKMFSLVI